MDECNRWVEACRNNIDALGQDTWKNGAFEVQYVEWGFPPKGAWVEHAGLKIVFAYDASGYLSVAVRPRH